MVFKLSSNGFSMEFKLKTNFKEKKVFNGVSIENNNPRRPSPQGKLLFFKAFDRNHSWSVPRMVL
jgi:hypothetical protein